MVCVAYGDEPLPNFIRLSSIDYLCLKVYVHTIITSLLIVNVHSIDLKSIKHLVLFLSCLAIHSLSMTSQLVELCAHQCKYICCNVGLLC